MNFSIRATIRGLAASEHGLSCPTGLWREGLQELQRRGGGYRESGAFLLGVYNSKRRTVSRFVYYDDLDPPCLDQGIVVFDGTGYGPLWALCRATGLTVVADVHTHLGAARQSAADRQNPMIAMPGHIAIIVPNGGRWPIRQIDLGIYVYEGQHHWKEYVDRAAARFFYVGIWG